MEAKSGCECEESGWEVVSGGVPSGSVVGLIAYFWNTTPRLMEEFVIYLNDEESRVQRTLALFCR